MTDKRELALKQMTYRKSLRLPPGTTKTLVWSGKNWTGTMTVPGLPESFTYTAGSETGCYLGLHRVYERWLSEHPEHQPAKKPKL